MMSANISKIDYSDNLYQHKKYAVHDRTLGGGLKWDYELLKKPY